jgi:hypothetical protein
MYEVTLPTMEGSMAETFAAMIPKERERLHKELENIHSQEEELRTKRTAVEHELNALDAYEAAKSGKPKRTATNRVARGSRQSSVLELISKHKGGVTRGDILEAMNLKGNKGGEQSVSNALSALKKGNKITSKDGKYVAA